MKDRYGPGSSTGGKGSLRQWNTNSYDPQTGRAHSSVDLEDAKAHVSNTHSGGDGRQLTDAFDRIDSRRTTIRTPVRDRSYTVKHEG
jgi:hypothetical protein